MSSLWWDVLMDKIEVRNRIYFYLFTHTYICYPIKLFITYAFIIIPILPYHFDKIFMQMRDELFLMRTGDKVRGVYSMGAIARRVGGWFLFPVYFCPLSLHVASTTTRCIYRSSVCYYERSRISSAKCTRLAPRWIFRNPCPEGKENARI